MTDLFPKPPRRLRQPTKRVLRDQLVIAADALIDQGERIAQLEARLRKPSPWWRRIFRRDA